MSSLSQSELMRRSEIFTTNGLKPEAQAVIVSVGFGPIELGLGASKLADVKAADASKAEFDAKKRKATAVEKIAHQAARKEITSLAETCRTLFAGNEPVLAHLGLQTQYETMTDEATGEPRLRAVRPSTTVADTIARWRRLVSSAKELDETEQDMLTVAGWTTVRLTALSTLVEGYATADTAQKAAIQQAKAASASLKMLVKDLEVWYSRARRLSRIKFKDEDPANMQKLAELLGLE